jgi:alpha-L-fucosidase
MRDKSSLAGLVLGLVLALAVAARAEDRGDLSFAEGPFKPTLQSLEQYRCPEWFRDAKFGIWAHWGPQAVPMDGDGYARDIYEEGSKHYQHLLKYYGHPSQFGYKDIIALWKAENWDPDRLMALYKKAGARYFVSMGCHYDNFPLWDSKCHRWNAVKVGPRRDVVAAWQQAAKKYGLPFGVSEHMASKEVWIQTSRGADRKGPKAGVPYDCADPKFADLYGLRPAPSDNLWRGKFPLWEVEWYRLVTELIDGYHPDLFYTDGPAPFGDEVGRRMIAHLYNSDLQHRGSLGVVYTCKQPSQGRWVEDFERGLMGKIDPHPWQTDTSIADWFYDRNYKYRPTSWVVHMLVDIVSKNGNLLLNIVQRPDGSLDAEVERMLAQLADWTAVNGEAIYGTRPWLVYGEGKVQAKGGAFAEDFAYTADDIRFTAKGKTLYAVALGWPKDGRLLVRSLAKPAQGSGNAIAAVSLLGYQGNLDWKQTAGGLLVTLPAEKPCDYTCALKITGTALGPVSVEPSKK